MGISIAPPAWWRRSPVPPTSGLLKDAGAVLSIGVARVGSGLIGVIPERWEQTSRALKNFVATDEDSSYEGLRSFTRCYFAKRTGRVLVVRLFADDDEWPNVRLPLLSSLATFTANPEKPNGPEAVVPSRPVPAGDGGRAPRRSKDDLRPATH